MTSNLYNALKSILITLILGIGATAEAQPDTLLQLRSEPYTIQGKKINMMMYYCPKVHHYFIQVCSSLGCSPSDCKSHVVIIGDKNDFATEIEYAINEQANLSEDKDLQSTIIKSREFSGAIKDFYIKCNDSYLDFIKPKAKKTAKVAAVKKKVK